MTDPSFDENSRAIETVSFDYDAIERELAGADLSPEQIEVNLKLFRALVRWLWSNGSRNPEGMLNRARLVCWIFIEELQPLSLSQIARAFGLHKQSMGRAHDDFKRTFPAVKTPHMRFD